MGTDNIIVGEYLASLSEDEELDKIFPLMLRLKGYRIVRTAKDAKGQPQHGKDIIAIGVDDDGIKKRFYFELKGHAAKDIDSESIAAKDGVSMSLHELRYVEYTDSSIPGFNELPVKVMFVHNGIVKPNAMLLFEGIVKELFTGREFQRWGIHELTDQFSRYLFGEYLLTDEENIRLFKKTLVLLTAPDYDLRDFKELISRLLANDAKVDSRVFSKLFSTLNLLAFLIYHYSKEADYLEPAKIAINEIILQTWSWILKSKLEKRKAVIREFRKLLHTQYVMLDDYFNKTLPAASLQDGLFSERGGPFEDIGYSMRAMEYISFLLYYFHLEQFAPEFNGRLNEEALKTLVDRQIQALITVIDSNIGCRRPLLDRHSKPVLLVALYILEFTKSDSQYRNWLNNYIVSCLDNILMIHMARKRYPEFNDNEQALIEYASTGTRPYDYSDKSSMMIMIFIELLAILDNKDIYIQTKKNFSTIVNLQTVYPNTTTPDIDLEQMYFGGNINDYMAVESSIVLPETFEEFLQFVASRPKYHVNFRTDAIGLPFLKYLASITNRNDIFPGDWRRFY